MLVTKKGVIKFTTTGEKITLTGETRNLGHGQQVQVICSDNSTGWEHIDDLV